jgi:hypothetical protein
VSFEDPRDEEDWPDLPPTYKELWQAQLMSLVFFAVVFLLAFAVVKGMESCAEGQPNPQIQKDDAGVLYKKPMR